MTDRFCDCWQVLIIVTDGDTIDLQDTITASMLLKGLKVNIFVIGIGTRLNQANLQRIVSRPEDLFQTKTFDELPKIAQSLKAVVCKKPTSKQLSLILYLYPYVFRVDNNWLTGLSVRLFDMKRLNDCVWTKPVQVSSERTEQPPIYISVSNVCR